MPNCRCLAESMALRIHLVANIHRPDALEAASGVAQWLTERGHEILWDPESARAMGLMPSHFDFAVEADLAVAFGGDGTLIRAAQMCAAHGTPILGVYFGRFGFVTQGTQDDVLNCLEAFFAGESTIESRMMLEAQLLRGGNPVANVHALNEVVLQRAVTARMMNFHVTIDGHHVTSYPADGVLVCSPTGSTAYNLSSGGPIMDPNVQAIVLTAIAPHTLSARPLVLRPESEVRLKIGSDGDAVLSADGQTRLHILSGDEIRVTKSSWVTNLVVIQKDDFIIKLGQRLLWSKGMVTEPF